MSIGYACKLIGEPKTAFKTCRLNTATPDRLKHIIGQNLKALDQMIEYNIRYKIKLFRISSDVIPFGSHEVNQLNWQRVFKAQLQAIGSKIKQADMRVTMHPGQYTVLNASDERVWKNAIRDLQYHADFLDALFIDKSHKIILHVGGVYGNKLQALKRFLTHYDLLSARIKDRLVIENDERNFTMGDIKTIYQRESIPLVFDCLHHKLNGSDEGLSEVDWISYCSSTWGKADGKQIIHYAQQKQDGKRGAHSDTIDVTQFAVFYQTLPNKKMDIMLEVKDKNISALKCINATIEPVNPQSIAQEWSKYRYYVLSKSLDIYQQVANIFELAEIIDPCVFYQLIDRARLLPEVKSLQINTAKQIWHQLDSLCSTRDKQRFNRLIEQYQAGKATLMSLKKHILQCAQYSGNADLVESYYFYLS